MVSNITISKPCLVKPCLLALPLGKAYTITSTTPLTFYCYGPHQRKESWVLTAQQLARPRRNSKVTSLKLQQ